MSMKKWTEEELILTRDKLEVWSSTHLKKSGWGPRLWLLTAIMGAFAISTGVVFMFLDGVTVLSIILIILGSVTCFSWYQSEKQKKGNIAFLAEVNKELIRRKKVSSKSKADNKNDKLSNKKKTDKDESTEKVSE